AHLRESDWPPQWHQSADSSLLGADDDGDDDGERRNLLRPLQPRKRAGTLAERALPKHNIIITSLCLMLVLIGASNRVAFRLMQYALVNYSYFTSQFTILLYVPFCLVVVLGKISLVGGIPAKLRAVPLRHFAVIGILDGLMNFLLNV